MIESQVGLHNKEAAYTPCREIYDLCINVMNTGKAQKDSHCTTMITKLLGRNLPWWWSYVYFCLAIGCRWSL